MADDLIFANGINATTGRALTPPLTSAAVARAALGLRYANGALRELEAKIGTEATHGVIAGINPEDLAESGWGIIFAAQAAADVPAIREALAPLLALRQAQAGTRYREYDGDWAYYPGESKTGWLARVGGEPGPVDPEHVPYYLLIVASPAAIPFSFQYQLDVQYAVGRLHFDGPDQLDRYAAYAATAVAAEKNAPAPQDAPQAPFDKLRVPAPLLSSPSTATRPTERGLGAGHAWSLTRRAAFFGVASPDDDATGLSRDYLVAPLAADLQARQADWDVAVTLGADATKDRLHSLINGPEPPTFLFTASHGMGFPWDHPLQARGQGALLCADWPGPRQWRDSAIPDRFYFSGDDVADSARLTGMISFHFACYGAGTPRLDEFSHLTGAAGRAQVAPVDFLACLPQRLAGHPKGGALAVIGHVERAWGASFIWNNASAQLAAFRSTMRCLAAGGRVGLAMDSFNLRYAEIATILNELIQEAKAGAAVDDRTLAGLWIANNDARSYIIVGDPAVRLPLTNPTTDPLIGL